MPLSSQALTTVTAFESIVGAGAYSADALAMAIEVASARFAKGCARTFHYKPAHVELCEGYGSATLLVSITPLISITSIEKRGGGDWIEYDADSYRIGTSLEGEILKESGAWPYTGDVIGIDRDPVTQSELPLIRVTCEGGYVTPEQAETLALPRTLPYDIEGAVMMMSVSYLQEMQRDKTIKSEKILSGSTSYGEVKMITPEIQQIMRAWRRL